MKNGVKYSLQTVLKASKNHPKISLAVITFAGLIALTLQCKNTQNTPEGNHSEQIRSSVLVEKFQSKEIQKDEAQNGDNPAKEISNKEEELKILRELIKYEEEVTKRINDLSKGTYMIPKKEMEDALSSTQGLKAEQISELINNILHPRSSIKLELNETTGKFEKIPQEETPSANDLLMENAPSAPLAIFLESVFTNVDSIKKGGLDEQFDSFLQKSEIFDSNKPEESPYDIDKKQTRESAGSITELMKERLYDLEYPELQVSTLEDLARIGNAAAEINTLISINASPETNDNIRSKNRLRISVLIEYFDSFKNPK